MVWFKVAKEKEKNRIYKGRERPRILQKKSKKFWKYVNLPFIYNLLFWPHQKST